MKTILIDVVRFVSNESWIGIDQRCSLRPHHVVNTCVCSDDCIVRDTAIARPPQELTRRCHRTYEDIADAVLRAFRGANHVPYSKNDIGDLLRALSRG